MNKKLIFVSLIGSLLILGVAITTILIGNTKVGQFTSSLSTQPENKDTATTFLEQYCQRQDPNKNSWECSGLYDFPGGPQKFGEACQKLGYSFNCSGMCANGQCYLLTSKGKTCTDEKDCESGWCIPIDKTCTDNCEGSCSENFPPDQCSSAKEFAFKAIKKNKVVDVTAGGALCD